VKGDIEMWRGKVGRFGVTGEMQTNPIKFMSDGQQSRLVFAYLAECKPHILFLDEPTNHLDMESIDSLAGEHPSCASAPPLLHSFASVI
ncbi:hypothetical protein T484DRAFT_1802666, partial [Baffinella frigidus]